MTRRIVAIRPEPGLTETLTRAHHMGLRVTGLPLSQAEPVGWTPPAVAYDGLLVGSANVFRHGGSELEKLRDVPVLAVGERTADAARRTGWRVEATGEGGLQALLDALPAQPRRLLRLAGEQRVELAVPDSVEIDTVTLYRMRHHQVTPAQGALFSRGSVVLLHSGEAAAHFARECERSGIERNALSLAALAPRIAEAAGPGWGKVRVAPAPNDAALLAIAGELCESP
ncbi:uroporphyrinogen-III synthase [Erythrobacter sp. LQ02-29]|uniref:uroporphyrinogen-III synthase n=1 Tax=Erythrobacter sp. LQ02-29 TaxID=2920384 RepID=UPI001F4DC61F|nr:uroporphyrinogen-III synthase [Erythrobacter sp. LQ02-29]MCP9222651.1 uroporphyrinogen-III synthase [Erythrobacter sp. LQ02-29]